MRKFIKGLLILISVTLIALIIYKMMFFYKMYYIGGEENNRIDYVYSYVQRFEAEKNRKPNSKELSKFLEQFEDFQIDESDIYTGFTGDFFIINIKTHSAIFDEWDKDKVNISDVNFDSMYDKYSGIKFLFSDQSTFTLYAN
jgi:hypothetical protein